MSFDPRGPWSRRAILGSLGACSMAACIPDGELKRPFEMTPREREGDWPVGSPESVGLRSESVEAAYRRVFDPDQLPNIRSLLVARHGVLVGEGYVADAGDIDRMSSLMSATKSVTAMLAGIALERGALRSVETTIGEILPEARPGTEKGAITLHNMLEMRSGIDYSNDRFSLEMEWRDIENSVEYILDHPLRYEPGTVFEYTDACAHLCGALIQQATGQTLHEFARGALFASAGIRQSRWLSHADGRSFGAYGLFLTPRDFLRLGQEALRSHNTDSGAVPRQWLTECTTPQVEHDFDHSFDYGYFWWIAPDASGFTPEGHGGQTSFVDPELELVVTITADPNSNYNGVSVELDDVLELVRLIREGATS